MYVAQDAYWHACQLAGSTLSSKQFWWWWWPDVSAGRRRDREGETLVIDPPCFKKKLVLRWKLQQLSCTGKTFHPEEPNKQWTLDKSSKLSSEEWGGCQFCWRVPTERTIWCQKWTRRRTQQRTMWMIIVDECRLSVRFGAKHAKSVRTVCTPTGLPLCIAPLLVGKASRRHFKKAAEKGKKKVLLLSPLRGNV